MSARSVLSPSSWRTLQHSLRQPFRSRCLHSRSKQPHYFPRSQTSRPRLTQCLYQQRRHASTGSFISNTRSLYKTNPISLILATALIALGAGYWIWVNYVYQTYTIRSFHKFPEPVAKKLRRALYYTNYDIQPSEAVKYYRQALQIAEEVGMDAFSDEIIGVKIQVASLMERLEQYSKAIQILEILKKDCLEWIARVGGFEDRKQQRTRVLAKCVGISVKLGELYSTPVIYNRDAAEERLVWAVETVLKEQQRRQTAGATDESDGPWMSPSEIGAALEALAHNYEDKNQHYLATPLFLQALSLLPQTGTNCHSVILMNNLASSLAQQSPRAAQAAQAYSESRNIHTAPAGPPATRETMIDNAKSWAQKALDVAAKIGPPERDEECDIGCAVATHNLGEFAEMVQNFSEARQRYQEAISIARAIGFEEGVENSSARLRRLKSSGSG